MIRRDYILRMIEEFIQALARINRLKTDSKLQEAGEAVDTEFNRLVGAGAEAVAQLSETELLAKLLQGGPTQIVRDKALMLAALLKEAGDVAAARDRVEEGRYAYLKGLHLLLDTLARHEIDECPSFVPGIEMFVAALHDSPLPVRTRALLMQHYERTGQFAKAEDALFAILESEPANSEILDFGISFYDRLEGQSDDALSAGNLPRSELETGRAELLSRRKSIQPRIDANEH
jgi:hypothetical protein